MLGGQTTYETLFFTRKNFAKKFYRYNFGEKGEN